MNSSGFSISQYRSTEKTPLSAAAVDLTASAPGTTLYTAVLDAESDIYELLGVRGIVQADAGAVVTPATFHVEVTPADGSPSYVIQNDPFLDPASNGDFLFTFDEDALQGDPLELNLNKFAPHRNRAAEYPQLKAGDTLELKAVTQGVGGTQSVKLQFLYRNLGSAPDRSFVGQEINGTPFIGTGNEYPYSSAEGYPNYGRKTDEH